MRRLVCLTVLLGTFVMITISARAIAGVVAIGKSRIIWQTQSEMNRSCSAIRPLGACTTLRDLALTCRCVRSGSVFRREARVSGVPVTFIADSGFLAHEMGHVADFRSMLRRYVTAVEARTFATEPECIAAAGRVHAGFEDTIKAIRDESALRRDGTIIGGAGPSIDADGNEGQVVIHSSAAEGGNRIGNGRDERAGGAAPVGGDEALEPFLAKVVPR